MLMELLVHAVTPSAKSYLYKNFESASSSNNPRQEEVGINKIRAAELFQINLIKD